LVRRCLTLGSATAVITALLWTTSGFVIPAWIHYGAGSTSQLSAEHYRHFVVSNLLCGMIAATQSYYVVTFLSVRFCYPWLLQARHTDAREVGELESVARRGRILLALTVAVPFLAFAALLMINFNRLVIGRPHGHRFCRLRPGVFAGSHDPRRLSALAGVMNPSGEPHFGTDTSDSFLTGFAPLAVAGSRF